MVAPKRHEGRVALVSGAARGQGRAVATRLAREGADLIIFDLCERPLTSQYAGATADDLAETADAIVAAGGKCESAVIDVRDGESLADFVQVSEGALGTVDIVCANAGLVTWVPFVEMSSSQWQEVMDINVTGVFNTVKACLRGLASKKSGSIIITSSVNGREPGEGLAHYAASKHAVIGLMRGLALELGPLGIQVNAILPSAVNTIMGNNPVNLKWIFGREDATEDDYLDATRQWHILRNTPALNAADIAEVVSWLCSSEARYLTGAEIPIDAGHLILPGFNHRPIKE